MTRIHLFIQILKKRAENGPFGPGRAYLLTGRGRAGPICSRAGPGRAKRKKWRAGPGRLFFGPCHALRRNKSPKVGIWDVFSNVGTKNFDTAIKPIKLLTNKKSLFGKASASRHFEKCLLSSAFLKNWVKIKQPSRSGIYRRPFGIDSIWELI